MFFLYLLSPLMGKERFFHLFSRSFSSAAGIF